MCTYVEEADNDANKNSALIRIGARIVFVLTTLICLDSSALDFRTCAIISAGRADPVGV